MSSEFILVAKQILEIERRPLRPREIVDFAIRDKLFSDNIAGRTPHQTMKSKLSVDVRRKGDQSIFVRTSPGLFYLRSLLNSPEDVYAAQPIVKSKSDGDVLVFPSAELYQMTFFQGVSHSWKRLKQRILRPEVCHYLNRVEAERTDRFKQVLSYILVTRNGSILSYKRGNYNRVEDFLRGAYCVGFGGHIAQSDRNFFSEDMGLTDGAIRELNEELTLPSLDKARLKTDRSLPCIGVINDDSSDVGMRHIAFVFRYEVSEDPSWKNPVRGEKSITKLQWLSPGSLPIPIWNFEYWSQLCLREFFPSVVSTSPAFRLLRKASLIPPNILCIVGEVGCGKSEATRILSDRFGYSVVNSGRVLAELMGIPPIPITKRELFQSKAREFIARSQGPALLAAKICQTIATLDSNRILIDGIRHGATLDNLKKYLKGRKTGVLYVYTIPDVAFDFYRRRERHDISFSEFLGLRSSAVEKEVRAILGHSDAVLYNWTGLMAYKNAVSALAEIICPVVDEEFQ